MFAYLTKKIDTHFEVYFLSLEIYLEQVVVLILRTTKSMFKKNVWKWEEKCPLQFSLRTKRICSSFIPFG